MSLQVGQLVQGKYRIVRLIGEGGMGAVYEGENTAIQRRVAIKVLHGSTASSPDAVERFEREARAAGRIGNDHILEVLDLGTLDDGDRFMVLEFLDGETMAGRLQRLGKMPARDVSRLTRQILAGLGAAHGAGIVHRDLKPENIFILKEKAGTKDYVKIIDFGISKFSALNDEGMRMTATGAVMGTPYYMSPEQARGAGQTDQRSDLYAVGVIIYETVTGQVPYDGVTFNDLIFKIVLAEFTPARQLVPDLDPGFDSIIAKAMSKDPAFRFQTAAEFEEALAAWESSGRSVTIPPQTQGDAASRAGLGASRIQTSAGGAPMRGTTSTWAQSSGGAIAAGGKPPIAVVAGIAGGVALAATIGILAFRHPTPATATPPTTPVAAARAPIMLPAVAAPPPAAALPVPSVVPAATQAASAAPPPEKAPAVAVRAVHVARRAPKAAAATPSAPPAKKRELRDFGY